MFRRGMFSSHWKAGGGVFHGGNRTGGQGGKPRWGDSKGMMEGMCDPCGKRLAGHLTVLSGDGMGNGRFWDGREAGNEG